MLWNPSQELLADSNLEKFKAKILKSNPGLNFTDFQDFYSWSVENSQEFWRQAMTFLEIQYLGDLNPVLENPEDMLSAKWFPGVKLNFAENLLKCRHNKPALIFCGEDKIRIEVSYEELKRQVSSLASTLRNLGVEPGDRVGALVANTPQAVVGMLATASLGAIWSSCSPDFGVAAVLDRFQQIKPKVLVALNAYWYKGKCIDTLPKAKEIAKGLESLQAVVIAPYPGTKVEEADLSDLNSQIKVLNLDTILESSTTLDSEFPQFPFSQPLYIMYSSGTTGKPKCIVHGAGNVLLEQLKELVLHCNLKESDKIFYQTTCGWMMWNWLVASLAAGATLVLYDGFPLLNDGKVLIDLIDKENISIFGTNARYIASIQKLNIIPKKSHSLVSLNTILSTGSTLLPESFDYVYQDIKENVWLASISGGTDILGCFALGCPLIPVNRGELQTRSLGLSVEVFSPDAKPLIDEPGELVCSKPFPSQPLGFWNDGSKEKYYQAYFAHFKGIWRHGDWVELKQNGGMVFYGRSDATLNPGGVRIGTSEIYSQLESFPEIEEAVITSQSFENDERIVLFLKLAPKAELSTELIDSIKSRIRKEISPFHVPKVVLAVPDLPRTLSGKTSELAVKALIHGREVGNKEALANPESLEFFKGLEF